MSETVEEVIEDDIVSLRPVALDNYIGQEKMKSRLSISIDASRKKALHWIICYFMVHRG